jgi:hypothetical protein
VRAVPVVMAGVLARHRSPALCTVGKHPAGALGSCGANPPLGRAVRARGPRREFDRRHALTGDDGAKTLVNVASRSRIRKRKRADPVTDADEQVPRPLGGRRTARVGPHAPDLPPPGRRLPAACMRC